MNIRPVGAELVHADKRTDGRTIMMRLIFAFRNFSNAPKISGRHKIRLAFTPVDVYKNHVRCLHTTRDLWSYCRAVRVGYIVLNEQSVSFVSAVQCTTVEYHMLLHRRVESSVYPQCLK
jgi:hypothetical protein